MSFRELYDYAQTLTPPINPQDIRRKIAELCPGKFCRVTYSPLERSRLLGYYVSSKSEDLLYLKVMTGAPPGCALVVVGAHLDDDWKRFVEMKEILHLFDDRTAYTNSGDEFEELLAGLCAIEPHADRSPQMQSEVECFGMALALFCPEELRVDLARQLEAKTATHGEIATRLGIPELFVYSLFSPYYKENVAYLRRDR